MHLEKLCSSSIRLARKHAIATKQQQKKKKQNKSSHSFSIQPPPSPYLCLHSPLWIKPSINLPSAAT